MGVIWAIYGGAMSLLVTVQVLVWPMAIVPVQSARVAGGVARRTGLGDLVGAGVEGDRRCPATRRRRRSPGWCPDRPTVIVKSARDVVPPLSLMTCLMTVSCGAMSLLVTVQVLVSPMAIVPVQSARVAGGVAGRTGLGDR